MIPRERTLTLLLLTAGVGASYWLLSWLSEGLVGRRPPAAHEADYYMENFTRAAMDDTGAIAHRLNAQLMVHYADDGTTELVQPVLEVYNDAPTPWHVVSEKGWVSADNDVVLLKGRVKIWRDDEHGQRELEVITSDVRVLPQERYAETEQAATILAPRTEYHGVGMRAMLKENRVQLLSRVRGRHEVKQKS